MNTSLESEEAGEREGEIREEQSEDSDTDEVCRMVFFVCLLFFWGTFSAASGPQFIYFIFL